MANKSLNHCRRKMPGETLSLNLLFWLPAQWRAVTTERLLYLIWFARIENAHSLLRPILAKKLTWHRLPKQSFHSYAYQAPLFSGKAKAKSLSLERFQVKDKMWPPSACNPATAG